MSVGKTITAVLGEASAQKFEDLFDLGTSERRIAEDLVRYLDSIETLAFETELMSKVPGKRSTKVNVLRSLVRAQIIQRIGEGRRKAPYQYSVNLNTALKRMKESGTNAPVELANPIKRNRSHRKSTVSAEPDLQCSHEVQEWTPSDEELEQFTILFQLLRGQNLKMRQSS